MTKLDRFLLSCSYVIYGATSSVANRRARFGFSFKMLFFRALESSVGVPLFQVFNYIPISLISLEAIYLIYSGIVPILYPFMDRDKRGFVETFIGL